MTKCDDTPGGSGNGQPRSNPDGIVEGTAAADVIDMAYRGDPDGDRIDAADALLPGEAPNDDIVHAGAGADVVRAGLGDDEIHGESGNDSLFGEGGNDVILGGSGSDVIDGGAGDDIIIAAGTLPWPDRGLGFIPPDYDPANDRDTVFGGSGNDIILTGDDADYVDGGTGNDTILAGVDDDTVLGGDGNDVIVGGEGADSLDGGAGNDTIYGGLNPLLPDELNLPDAHDPYPDNGKDTIHGGAGDDVIYGQDDADLIYGDGGQDYLDGGVDNDTIEGGAGNDTILGGAGNDELIGGADRDLFIGVNSHDHVDGSEDGDDFDTLDLRGSAPAGGSLHVIYTSADHEDGYVEYFDKNGNPAGTLTFENIENVVPCFTPGTVIATPRGEIPVENLKVGDRIVTRDNGLREIRWVGRKTLDYADLARADHLKPVLIERGSLGNGLPEHDMLVSPNHRMLVANDRTALYFDEHEVLVAAKHLVNHRGIRPVEVLGVSYIHFMFDQHEVVLANGSWTESFQPGDYTLAGLGNAQRTEILELFPELDSARGVAGYVAARRTLKRHEAVLLKT